jgi:hypothetical protein
MENATSTGQKTLALNLDAKTYGTFAEIGAGQEVARRFFSVGGAAGTVAKPFRPTTWRSAMRSRLPVNPDWSPVGVYGGYHRAQPAVAHPCAHPGLLHQLLHALAGKARGLATNPGPVGLPCECFAY